MAAYWEDAKIIVNALRRDGLDYWAERLNRSGAGAATGGELADGYFALLVEILDLPSMSDDTRDKAEQLFLRLGKDLYHSDEIRKKSVASIRSRIEARRRYKPEQ
jgi:hypothetical protein